MNHFQQILLVGASLSLIAPTAAQVSETVNLEEINSYARKQTISSLTSLMNVLLSILEDFA